MALIYKLPDAFVEKHKALLDGWAWRINPEMNLAEQFPDEPMLARAVLEAVTTPSGMKIRSKTPQSMLAVRKYANAQAVAD